MRNIRLIAITCAAIFGAAGFLFERENGFESSAASTGPPASHTSAPGEANCTSCHVSFALNSGGGQLTINGLPKNYLPNQQIPVTVTLNHNGGIRYGFQLTAIDNFGNSLGVGRFVLPAANPQPLQVAPGLVDGHDRRYVEHTIDGITPTQFNTKSWNFTFETLSRRVGKIRFFAAGNGADSDGSADGDYIYTTSTSMLSGSAISNYDNDMRSDIAVYRPTTGTWYALTSTYDYRVFGWGEPGDVMAPGDYDGDGKTDDVVWRPSNTTWYFHTSLGYFYSIPFGVAGDIPVPADYDGDLRTDVAVWRPSTGVWYMIQSSNGTFLGTPFGINGDRPVPADYDGDARAEIAVFRPSNSTWHMIKTSDYSYYVRAFGELGDEPIQSDYDGDGRSDIAVYRPSNSTWYFLTASEAYFVKTFGVTGDKPVPADYDGDGLTDVAVFREGVWYYIGSEALTYNVINFGVPGDIPVARGYIPQ